MTPKEAMKEIQRRTGYTQQRLAEEAGFRQQHFITQFLQRNIKVAVFQKLLNCMGYEIVVRPKDSADKAEEIVIEEEYIWRKDKRRIQNTK